MARDLVEARALRRRLLAWHTRHGRHDLPWQRSRDPYRIWVSEIMLQQTQVSTVIPYYQRFLKRFPNVASLARARLDSVLHHWTGLGYYARARNLKKAAEIIVREHGGRFPRDLESVVALPGIGRSTAGAILAFAFDQRHPILDGNVKRVLARLHAVVTPVNRRDTEQQLWRLAEHYTPRARVADYTQAIMDLGATLCTPRKPDCVRCPLTLQCAARAEGEPERYPVRTARKALPVKKTVMLMIRDVRGRVLLTRRPASGIWGGLWSFPECTSAHQAVAHCRDTLGLRVAPGKPWKALHHRFSHFHLQIHPLPARLVGANAITAAQGVTAAWFQPTRGAARGLASPVQNLLAQLLPLRPDS
jgi:A/G-specific adenine glycosylase